LKKLLLVAVFAALGVLTGSLLGCGDAQLPYLTAIQINPASPSIAAGRSQQFTAMGTFSNGQTQDVSSRVTWSSSTPIVGVINSTGFVQTYSQGTSTITATTTNPAAGTVTGTLTLTVGAPALVAVTINDAASVLPSTASLKTATVARATGHQFFAYGIYSDGGLRNITNSVTWASAPATTATITNTGYATGVAAGTAAIAATDPTTSIAATPVGLTVTSATPTAIVVYPVGQTNAAPTGQTIAANTRLPYAALAQFSDGTRQDVTADATWTSTVPATASVSTVTPKGVATAVAAGATQIQATLGGGATAITGQTPLNVSTASLTSIAVTPATSGVAIGSTLQMNAVGTFSNGTTQSINLAAAWSITPSSGSIATVSTTGLVTGVSAGSATVTAKIGTITMNAVVNVQAVKSIAVAPAVPIVNPSILNIAQGTASQFIATATLADGTTQDISASVTWISTVPPAVTGTLPVVSVSDSLGTAGWVLGNTPGTDTVEAIFGGVAGVAPVIVTNATLKTLTITPIVAQNIALGMSVQYTATATFSDSTTQNLSNQVTWTTSLTPPGIAVVNLTGLATSTGIGTTNVIAAASINGSAATNQVALTVH
jgi:trimeric autotransporter adhesin